MKFLAVAVTVLAAVLLALAPAIGTIYDEAYPDDATKRAALAACVAADPSFNRLLAEERARCYSRLPQSPPPDLPLAPRREEIADSGLEGRG